MVNRRSVVITGAGPVSALGLGREAFREALRNGTDGVDEITMFDAEPYGVTRAAEIPDFDVDEYLVGRKTYLDRASEIAFAATALAVRDARLELAELDRSRLALAVGSAAGSQETSALFFEDYLAKGPRFVKPILFPHTYSNTAGSLLAIEYKLDGPHLNFASGLVSSGLALTAAVDLIRQGRADAALAGGYEALSEVIVAGYALTGDLAANGEHRAAAPFGLGRTGFVLGEAGAMLVLEEQAHARSRGAEIRAEVLGVGMASGPAVSRDAAGASHQAARAMGSALDAAGLPPAELGCLLAGANGSRRLDAVEAEAIDCLFGQTGGPAVTAIKSMTGEPLGAGAAIQVAAALECLTHNFIPAILNLERPDPDVHLDLVLGRTLVKDVKSAMVNALDPGGAAVSIVLGAPPS